MKAEPANEELGNQWFIAMVRNHDYKGQQAAAITLQKNFKSNKYHWWSIMSLVLQAISATGNSLSLTLAERMATRALSEGRLTRSEEFYLLLRIYILQQKHAEALSYLHGTDSKKVELGNKYLPGNIELLRTKRDLLQKTGEWKALHDETKKALEGGDEDWNTIAAFCSAVKELPNQQSDSKNLLKSLAEAASPAHRGTSLARLELATKLDASKADIIDLCGYYFTAMGSKFCYFEDIQPYLIGIEAAELHKLVNDLDERTLTVSDPLRKVRERINVAKLHRYCELTSRTDLGAALSNAAKYTQEYADALPLGRGLEDTETQHGNPFVLLAAHWLIDAAAHDQKHLIQAVVILEHAIRRSRADYQLKLLLIRLYRLLGSFERAIEIYETLDIKQVQNDTLSHYLNARIASLAPLDRLQPLLSQAESVYRSNEDETPDLITQAYNYGTYSKIEEFIEFGDRLETSVQRSLTAIERIRLGLLCVPAAYTNSNQYNATSEAMSFIGKVQHPLLERSEMGPFRDNRDVKVLDTFTPAAALSTRDMTLAGPQPAEGWIRYHSTLLKNLQCIANGSWKEVAMVKDSEQPSDITEEERRTVLVVQALMQLCIESTRIDGSEALPKAAKKVHTLMDETSAAAVDGHPGWKLFHRLNAENERILYFSVAHFAMTTIHSKMIHKGNAPTVKHVLDDLRQQFAKKLEANKGIIDILQQSYSGINNRDTIIQSIKSDNVLQAIWEDDEVYGTIVRITDGWKKCILAMQMMAKGIRL